VRFRQVSIFGESGVLQAERGPVPPSIEIFGEVGVLQGEPGFAPPSPGVEWPCDWDAGWEWADEWVDGSEWDAGEWEEGDEKDGRGKWWGGEWEDGWWGGEWHDAGWLAQGDDWSEAAEMPGKAAAPAPTKRPNTHIRFTSTPQPPTRTTSQTPVGDANKKPQTPTSGAHHARCPRTIAERLPTQTHERARPPHARPQKSSAPQLCACASVQARR
jgi:hypothetical protein